MRIVLCIGAWLMLAPLGVWAQRSAAEQGSFDGLINELRVDFRYHYSSEPLTTLAIGFGGSAILANSNADARIQQYFREQLQNNSGDRLASWFTDVGDLAQPLFSLPIYLGAMWLGDRNGEQPTALAQWGARSLRASLIGTPELVTLAYLSGGQRPEEGEPGWDPFADNNGVSGHAFYGAVPIITAARMSDKRWLRYTLYVTSTLPGLARVYEDKHYFSQAFMGWWLANLAVDSVLHTDAEQAAHLKLMPVIYSDGAGVQLSMRF